MGTLATAIPVDIELAKQRVKEYGKLAKQNLLSPVDQILATAYGHVSAGRSVVDVREAIAGGGWDHRGLPKLAVARADAEIVRLRITHDKEWIRTDDDKNSVEIQNPAQGWMEMDCRPKQTAILIDRITSQHFAFDLSTLPPFAGKQSELADRAGHWPSYVATIPQAPPHITAIMGEKATEYHYLFEADWKEEPKPRDPYLLKWCGGHLFAVIAEWDVSPLEAAAMRPLLIGELPKGPHFLDEAPE